MPRERISRRGAFSRARWSGSRASSSPPTSSPPSSAASPEKAGSSTAPRPGLQLPATLIRQSGCSRSPPRGVCLRRANTADQLAVYSLDPPRFVLAIAETGGNTARLGFGEATRGGNAHFVRIMGGRELYLLPGDRGEGWQLAGDRAEGADNLLLPVSITGVGGMETLSPGMLYGFERDPAGLWFHHVG